MADVKISGLPASTVPLAGTEVLPIVQGGATKQVSIANVTAGRAVSAASLALTTTPLPVTSGGTGLATLATGQVPYGNGTSALNSSSNLTFSGTDLVVGAAYPAVGCQLANTGVFAAQRNNTNYVGYISNLTTAGNAGFLTFQYGASQTEVGSISTNGSTTTYAITSDRRLKENIESITSEQSGNFIDSLLPRTYTRINSGEKESGFIADEFQIAAPGSVLREPNEVDENGKPRYQLIDASTPEVIANIVAELQSLRARLKAANIA